MKIKIFLFLAMLSVLFFASCSKESVTNNPNNSGEGGSMARFVIVDNYLYSVDNTTLHIYNISQANQPVLAANVAIGMGIETIFSFKNYLFIGSTSGMFIYDISNPTNPTNSINFQHATACDPVVANDSLAFITLRGGGDCNNFVESGLYIVDIKNIYQSQQIGYLYMQSPYGLGYDGNTLFVCDGTNGLWVFDYTNPQSLTTIAHIENFTTYDVIPQDGILLVVGPDELRQYDYTNLNNINLLSTLKYVP